MSHEYLVCNMQYDIPLYYTCMFHMYIVLLVHRHWEPRENGNVMKSNFVIWGKAVIFVILVMRYWIVLQARERERESAQQVRYILPNVLYIRYSDRNDQIIKDQMATSTTPPSTIAVAKEATGIEQGSCTYCTSQLQEVTQIPPQSNGFTHVLGETSRTVSPLTSSLLPSLMWLTSEYFHEHIFIYSSRLPL